MTDSSQTNKRARLVLLGIPWDEQSSYMKGPAEAPPLIREAFRCDSTNMWSELGVNLAAKGVFEDAGDLSFHQDEDVMSSITSKVAELLDGNLHPIILGGDHAVTYPVVQAFGPRFPDLNILHIDAHPDLYDDLDGNRLSHACPFARILEEGHAKRLVQVGIRGMNGHLREQAKRFGVEVHEMKDFQDDLTLSFDGPLYISFDLDGIDPAFAPGVSHFEPGGLTTRQAIGIIHRLKASDIVGADIVEYNPRRDPTGVTAMVAAKLFKEIASQMLGECD